MNLKTLIKAASINNLSDARYFAAMGANWLGFCLDVNNASYIEPETVKEITQWVQGPEIVGEFGSQEEELIIDTANRLNLNYIQIPIELYKAGLQKKWPAFVKIDLNNEDSLANHFNLFLEDGDFSLLYIHFSSWAGFSNEFKKALYNFCLNHATIFELNFKPAELETILHELPIKGLNLHGGDETQPGMKTFDNLSEIFDTLNPEP